MHRALYVVALVAAVLFPCLVPPAAAGETRRDVKFTADWRFHRGPAPGAEAVTFDDSKWTSLRLPHDWAIAGPFDPKGNPETGKLLWAGEGWYRKRFALEAADAGKQVFFDFDGVMANPTVWINGRKAGSWDYGYCPFRIDGTAFVRFGAENVIAVRADTRTVETRWYPGGGVYRSVRMVVCDPVCVAWNGVWVRTTKIEGEAATLAATVTVANRTTGTVAVVTALEIFDPDGRPVGRGESRGEAKAGSEIALPGTIGVAGVQRWDISNPRLYRAKATVSSGNRITDVAETTFGIREFRFDAEHGFFLNGRKVPIQGVCLHHDQGPLGAAFLPRAMERQLELLKEMGCNAIRTSHNIPAAEVLDLCDRMGILVYAEGFDKWSTSIAFPAYAERQIRNFVLRDRNHPSIVLWGAGNELRQQRGYDAKALSAQVVGTFKRFDPDRPVTIACSAGARIKATGLEDPLDVGAYNYRARYVDAHGRSPQRPVLASETASALSTRGYYEIPHRTDYGAACRQMSSYDRQTVVWGSLPDQEFADLEACPYVAGEFVWSGFDYLGEPTPYGAPMVASRRIKAEEAARSSFFGILDLCGLPKDRYYLYRSHWASDQPTVHILPHWNWAGREGQPVPVYVYTSGDSAELFLNGRSLGRKSKRTDTTVAGLATTGKTEVVEAVMDRYRLRWEDVRYEPGHIRAVAYRQGQVLGESDAYTAGPPASLKMTPDRKTVAADGDDLLYVTVEALDKAGRPCPDAENMVVYRVGGGASLAGVGNGDPHSMESFGADRQKLFHGKGVVILRTATGRAGAISLEASAEGLLGADVTVESR